MKASLPKNPIALTIGLAVLAVSNLSAATHYVSVASPNPTPPYTNWSTAASGIQEAVNVAAANDVVLVTNGTYPGGVSVTNALALLSVNGPQFTEIDGGGTNQCASLVDGASLTGFAVTNGWDNIGNGGGGVWCSSTNAFLTNCIITGNGADSEGGGVFGGTLYNCVLTGNSAIMGGGAESCILYNCTLTGNSARTFASPFLSAAGEGGGACESTLYNCALSGNLASDDGGGAYDCTLYNCIVYFNTASVDSNYDSSCGLNYCCTTPLPSDGVGNIDSDPQLASASHLSADSPCIGAGSAAYAIGTDIDGEPWLNPPSIGCNQYRAGTETGPLTVDVQVIYTNVAVGYPLPLTALIGGRPTDSVWDFGDGDIALNEPYITHSWTQPGEYQLALWAFNESNPDGVIASVTIYVIAQPVAYVSLTSANPQPPYATWGTAATNIQDAVDEPVLGAIVMVTNGVYPGGLTVANPVSVISANGPQLTVIDGGGLNPCVSLSDGASITGFTLTNGNGWYAGGVVCTSTNAFVTNCVISGNSLGGAYGGTFYNCTLSGNSAPDGLGGGAYDSTLYNCTLTGNSALYGHGGGVFFSTLYNCTLSGNSAGAGGGACSSTLYNCTLTGNSADLGGGAYYSTLYDCTLSGNLATNLGEGGGAYECTLNNCALSGNSAFQGGGASWSTLNGCNLTGNSAYWGSGADGSILNDCTLTGNSASYNAYGGGAVDSTLNNCVLHYNGNSTTAGGGAWDCTLNNCAVSGNIGGGVGGCTLNNCTLTGNTGGWSSDYGAIGGGAWDCTLNNCTVCGNTYGGVGGCMLNNCIVYFNSDPTFPLGANYDPSSVLNYCCTTPMPTNGVGNITNAPLFVDYANGSLRLQSNSPCINSGNNAYVTTTNDLDGNPRISGGTVDIGAYEFQNPASIISYAWLQQYGLPSDGSMDQADLDGTGFNVYQDWVAGLNPTNALSVLRMVSVVPQGTNVIVTWQSVAGINYFLECSTNPGGSPCFTCVATNIVGQTALTTFIHTNAVGPQALFYRVGVTSQ